MNWDIMEMINNLKWNLDGHVARRTNNRWTTGITFWIPCEQRPFDLPRLSRKIEGLLLAGYVLDDPGTQREPRKTKDELEGRLR